MGQDAKHAPAGPPATGSDTGKGAGVAATVAMIKSSQSADKAAWRAGRGGN